jgi:hypothetical protein
VIVLRANCLIQAIGAADLAVRFVAEKDMLAV